MFKLLNSTSGQEVELLQINAEKAPFLVERLKIWMLPTLALVKQEKTTDYVVGFDELGGKDDFQTEVSLSLTALPVVKYVLNSAYLSLKTFMLAPCILRRVQR